MVVALVALMVVVAPVDTEWGVGALSMTAVIGKDESDRACERDLLATMADVRASCHRYQRQRRKCEWSGRCEGGSGRCEGGSCGRKCME